MSQWIDERGANNKFIMALTSDEEIGYSVRDYNAPGTLLHDVFQLFMMVHGYEPIKHLRSPNLFLLEGH